MTGVDPASTTLGLKYDELCARFIPLGLDELGESREEKLGVIPGTWESIEAVLPTPRAQVRTSPSGPVPPAPKSAASGRARLEREYVADARIQVGAERTPADIVLYGFSKKWVATLQEMAQNLDLRTEEPPIYRFENVTLFRTMPALYDENGRILEETRARRGPRLAQVRGGRKYPETMAIPRDAVRVAEPVLYGGQLRAHWGHFLTEGISRLWALELPEVEPSMPVLFSAARNRKIPFIECFLRHAGIGEDRVLPEPREVTTFEHMLVPHASFSLLGQAFSCHAALP